MNAPAASNLFETALREGAGLTYAAMLSAGLADSHNPLPTDENGLGLAALALDCHSGAQELCASLLLSNIDTMAPHALPRSIEIRHCASAMGIQSAPLASLAIASNRDEFSPMWNMLSNESLVLLADSALPMAAYSNNLTAAKALLAAGANPNVIDKTGTPACARCKSSAMLALFAQSGADLRAPIPSQSPQQPSSVLELILGTASNSAEPKAMREFAAEWARAHQDNKGAPGDDLARSAFSALSSGNKDSARRCIAALGQTAASRRDAEGFSMLARACQHGNLAEATKLLDMGADPYEPTPDGRSPWGMLLSHRGRQGQSIYGDRTLQERASSLCQTLSSKRKFKNVPWTKTWTNGWTTLGTLAGSCEAYEFALFSEKASAEGLAPNAPIGPHGLGAQLTLLLACLINAPWCATRVNFRHDIDPRALAFCESIQIDRIDDRAANAFAEQFFTISNAYSDGMIHHEHHLLGFINGPLRMPINRFLTPGSKIDIHHRKAAEAIERGIEARGRLGLPMLTKPDGPKHRQSVDDAEYVRLLALYEKGALARVAAAPELATRQGPRL